MRQEIEKERKTARQELVSSKKKVHSLQDEITESEASVKRLKQELEESQNWMSDVSFTSTPVKAADEEVTPSTATQSSPVKVADKNSTP